MNFLYPQFLFGLFAIGIPIIIHLFNLQRTKKVYFSNTAFLKNVQNLSKSSIKVKNLLILLSRILFIIFLVLAFAQPFFPDSGKLKNADFINLYIDNSLSTQSSIGNDKVLDISVRSAESLAKGLPESSVINVFTNDFGNLNGQWITKEKVSEFVSEIDFSSKSKNLNEVFSKKAILKNPDIASGKRATYTFSDFQKSALGDLRNIKLDSNINYYLIPVTPEEVSNIYIDSVWLENPYVNINENNFIKVRVVNSGKEQKKNVLLKLTIDNRQIATSSVNLEANSNDVVSISFSVTSKGIKKGIVSISDYPVVFDNEYYFSIKTVSKIKILEINEGQEESSPYIQKVYNNKDLFELTTKNIDNLDYSLLQGFDLVVLNNLNSIPEGFSESVVKFVNSSGSILVIPSDEIEETSYNSLLNKFSILIDKTAKNDSSSQLKELQQPDLNNPFYHGIFESTKERMILPKESASMKWNRAGTDLLSFKNDDPFLSQIGVGNSKIFIFSSSLRSEQGFSLNALFVPVMYKIGLLSNATTGKLAYNTKEQIINVQVGASQKNSIFKLFKDSLEIIPGQRLTGRNLILEVPDIELNPGHYELKLDNEVVDVIAFNYAEEESLMDFYSSDDLEDIFGRYGNVNVFESVSGDDIASEIEKTNRGFPIWKLCLIIALFFLFIEILLLRFYKPYENSLKIG
ncbi:MAG TPA: BatA domain-containing protein [Cytophagales bacterium]|nr:BatA domain-containing protein [Cytophagales bacterium]